MADDQTGVGGMRMAASPMTEKEAEKVLKRGLLWRRRWNKVSDDRKAEAFLVAAKSSDPTLVERAFDKADQVREWNDQEDWRDVVARGAFDNAVGDATRKRGLKRRAVTLAGELGYLDVFGDVPPPGLTSDQIDMLRQVRRLPAYSARNPSAAQDFVDAAWVARAKAARAATPEARAKLAQVEQVAAENAMLFMTDDRFDALTSEEGLRDAALYERFVAEGMSVPSAGGERKFDEIEAGLAPAEPEPEVEPEVEPELTQATELNDLKIKVRTPEGTQALHKLILGSRVEKDADGNVIRDRAGEEGYRDDVRVLRMIMNTLEDRPGYETPIVKQKSDGKQIVELQPVLGGDSDGVQRIDLSRDPKAVRAIAGMLLVHRGGPEGRLSQQPRRVPTVDELMERRSVEFKDNRLGAEIEVERLTRIEARKAERQKREVKKAVRSALGDGAVVFDRAFLGANPDFARHAQSNAKQMVRGMVERRREAQQVTAEQLLTVFTPETVEAIERAQDGIAKRVRNAYISGSDPERSKLGPWGGKLYQQMRAADQAAPAFAAPAFGAPAAPEDPVVRPQRQQGPIPQQPQATDASQTRVRMPAGSRGPSAGHAFD